MSDVPPGGVIGRRISRRHFLEMAALAAPAATLLSACASSSSSNGGTTTSFPVGAAAGASHKPVPVTLWHSMSGENLTTIEQLAAAFNASQHDVRTTLVAQPGYPATLSAYTAALSGGGLPDLVQIDTIDLQLMIDSQSTVPAGEAVAAEKYDLSDFLPSTVEYFRVGGVLEALPFNISTQLLYYDQGAFRRAGLDPASPPRTLDEVRACSEQIVSRNIAKYGMSLKLTASNFEEWIAIGGGEFLNHGNGRQGRATAVSFGGSLGQSIFDWFGGMLNDKLAQATSGTNYDNLFAIPNKTAPMTTETSAALGTVVDLLSGNQFPGVQLGIGPLPGPPGPGGVTIGGAGMYLVKGSSPERIDGAWQFLKYLLLPTSQATWAAQTGYLPVRKSSVGTPTLARAWAAVPGYKVAYDQLLDSPANLATAGGVSGAFADIETAVVNALTAVSNGTLPSTALSQAVQASNQAISSYNARV